MTREDLVKQNTLKLYDKYNIEIPFEDLPWSGELIETKLNTGEVQLVDRLVEFTLCAAYSYYFIDRYCFTYDPQKGPVPLRLFNFQLQALEEFQKNQKVIFRKSRQVGASIVTGCYALWRANFQKAQIIKVISLTLTDALEFKEKTIDLNYYEMPGFLKSKTTRDGYSKTRLKLMNQSSIRVLPKSKQAGRGGTPSLVIIDEAAFNEWMDDIWKSILPSLDKGGDCIVISTTNGVGNWYHITYSRAEQKQNDFHPIYIPWWKYPKRSNPWLQDILDGKIEDVESFVKEKANEQLSYEGDPQKAPWLWKMKAGSKTKKEFDQEIMAEFLGSGETVITPKTMIRIQDSIKEPKWVDTLPTESVSHHIPGLWCWKETTDHMYMITADTATGHGQDFSAFHVIDIDEGEQVADYKYQIPTDRFGEVIKTVARYYNQAYVVIETNHPGPAAFNEIYRSKTDPYHNVYARKKGKALVSWETTAKSRVLLIEDFFKDLENGHTTIHSGRFLDEVKTFNWNDNGKPEASKGNNDDLVMSYAIYCHMKDHVFGSRPLGISSNSTKSSGLKSEIDEMRIQEKEKVIEDTYGVDMETYYWLQGRDMPEEIKAYEKNENEKNKKASDIKLDRPPEWLRERMREAQERNFLKTGK